MSGSGLPAKPSSGSMALGQMLVELEVEADDGAHRRRHGLVAIAFAQMRLQPLLGRLRLHEHEARRQAVVGAVGPIFMRSTSSVSRLSGTSRGCQARCVRASRNSCSSTAVVQSHRSHGHLPASNHPASITKTPLEASGASSICIPDSVQRLTPAEPPARPGRNAEQVLDAVAQGGRRTGAAGAGAAHVQEHNRRP